MTPLNMLEAKNESIPPHPHTGIKSGRFHHNSVRRYSDCKDYTEAHPVEARIGAVRNKLCYTEAFDEYDNKVQALFGVEE